MDTEEKIIFSTCEPMLLSSFWCKGVFVREGNQCVLISELSVDMEITEARTLDGTNAKIISNMKMNLRSHKITMVLFSHPILIRPEFFYTISIKELPNNYYFDLFEPPIPMTLESNIKIEFHNDNALIRGLDFKKL